MTFKGINPRSTAGGGTDGANDSYMLTTDGYGTSRSPYPAVFGNNGSWESTADRTGSGVDQRFLGLFESKSDGSSVVRIALESGPGDYKIRFITGDYLAARSVSSITIKDGAGGSTLLSISGSTGAADSFMDASSAVHTRANFFANETTPTLTFAASLAEITFGSGVFWSHVAFEPVGGGGGSSTGAGLLSSPLLSGRLLRGLVR